MEGTHTMKHQTVARIEVLAVDEYTEAVTVVVRRCPPSGYEVFVGGGLLSGGQDSYMTGNVAAAMLRAAQEATVAMQGKQVGNDTLIADALDVMHRLVWRVPPEETVARTEVSPPYGIDKPERKSSVGDDTIIADALAVVRRRLKPPMGSTVFTSIRDTKDLASLRLAALPHEAFGVLWFNAQHQLIEDEIMFRGTLTATSVYPREILKAAMSQNAAACVLMHNHPSGSTAPSRADEALTQMLKTALALVDVRVLDHLIVGGGTPDVYSFSENGLL